MRALWDVTNTVEPSFVREFGLLSHRFTLENGENEPRENFPDVTAERYEDELHVTEVGPFTNYARSKSRRLADQGVRGARLKGR